MNTKLIMTVSALFLFIIGAGATFFPAELLEQFKIDRDTRSFALILQILGALYVGFAMLNWMAKGAHVGGIYNRPIAIANFAHFAIAGIAFIKALKGVPQPSYGLLAIIVFYIIFAFLFGVVLFRNPAKK